MSESPPDQSGEIEKWKRLADKLDKLQESKNKGLGVSCIQQIAIYLRWGDVGAAKQFCRTDHDKIENYPDIKQVLIDELFAGEENHPWKSFF